MKKSVLQVAQVVLFLGLGIALLWYIFNKQNIHSIIQELYKTNFYWIAVSMLVGLLSHVFRAIRWNLLFQQMGYKPSVLHTSYAVLIGYLANFAVPRMGEITRCGVVSKREGISVDKVIGTVIGERAFDMLSLVVILFLTVIFQISLLGDFVDRYLLTSLSTLFHKHVFLLIVSTIILLLLLFISIKFVKPLLKNFSFYTKIRSLYIGFLDGITTIVKQKSFTLFALYTVCIWLCYILMVYTCLLALPATAHLCFIDAITIMAIGSIGIVIPVPGGIGTYHYIVSLTLTQLYFISDVNSLALATISHSSQTLMILIAGSISLLLVFLSRKK